MALAGFSFSAESGGKVTASDLQKSFQKTEDKYRPKTRWWWDKPLDHAELFRQLDTMHAQGMGGVEIVPWKAPDYGSKECNEAIVACVEHAAKLGMTVHLTPTQSWPWTLPDNVDVKTAASRVLTYGKTEVLTGPTQWSGTAPKPVMEPAIMSRMQVSEGEVDAMRTLVAVTLVPVGEKGMFETPRIEGGRALQVTKDDGQGGPLPSAAKVLPCQKDFKSLEIPPGKWVVMAWWSQPVGKNGKRWILDLWDRTAIEAFYAGAVQPILDKLDPKLIGQTLVDVYSDNPENWQQTWCTDFLSKFQKECGYDLVPYLHCGFAMEAGKENETAKRVQTDVEETQAVLMREGYGTASEWLRKRNLLFRAETYGPAAGKPEDNYGFVDTPELECMGNWLDGGGYTQKGLSSGVSAAHLFGKSLVSCETFTFLTTGFPSKAKPAREQHATLAMLRKASDDLYSVGVQQFVFHGYPSRPILGAKELTTTFFAHSWINHANSFYPFLHGVTDRMARLSCLLRAGEPVFELCVVNDEITQHIREGIRIGEGFKNRYLLDLVTGAGLIRADKEGLVRVENGLVKTASVSYRAILVDGSATSGETLEVVKKLAEVGATIVLAGSGKTHAHAGFHGIKEKADHTQSALKSLSSISGKGKVISVAKIADWKTVAEQVGVIVYLEGPAGWDGDYPDPKGKRRYHNTYWQYRRGADWDLFFIHNNHLTEDRSGEWTFRVEGEPELWDANTGEVKGLSFVRNGKEARVKLDLPADGTAVVVFRRDGKAAKYKAEKVVAETPLAGPWKMTFRHVNNSAPIEQTIAVGQDWRTTPGLEKFSGNATATMEIGEIKLKDGQRCFLDFGKVHEVISVSHAGKELGVAWEPPYRIEITSAVKAGAKRVEVKVANNLAAAFDHYKDDQLPSGIFGPVKTVTTETKEP